MCRKPFTIHLNWKPRTHVVQEVVLGIDPGRTNIGLCAVREDGKSLFAWEIKTRNKDVSKLMEKRKMHRQASRRGERLRRKRRAKKNGTSTDRWNPRHLPGCTNPMPVRGHPEYVSPVQQPEAAGWTADTDSKAASPDT